VITVTFPPSKNLESYLIQYIMDHFSQTENQVDILSKHVHNRLLRICKRGPRGKVLTLAEIERAKVRLRHFIYNSIITLLFKAFFFLI